MRKKFTIGSVFGIAISIDPSWVFIFLLVTFSLAFGLLSPFVGELGVVGILLVSIIAAILFFVSVLAHEVSHSLVARSKGVNVNQITLFLFGGVSNIEREPPSPGAEFLIAIVGPITSIVIGGLCLVGVSLVATPDVQAFGSVELLQALGPWVVTVLWLGAINVLLGVFNLVPGFPLDGGRMLRAVFWKATGSLERATRWASLGGKLVAAGIIITGSLMVIGVSVPFFGSGFIGGVWLIFIGWFLFRAAGQSYQQMIMTNILEKVQVKEIMRENTSNVSPQTSIEEFVNKYIVKSDRQAYPVMEQEKFIGVVSVDDIQKADRNEWKIKKIKDIMSPPDTLETVQPEESVSEALIKLTRNEKSQAPVVQNERFIGLLNRDDIFLWLRLHS